MIRIVALGSFVVMAVAGISEAQDARVFLQKSIEAGATQVEGKYQPLAAGVAPELELWVAGKDGDFRLVAPTQVTTNLQQGTFTFVNLAAFAEDSRVRVRLLDNSSGRFFDSLAVSVTKPKDTEVEVLNASAVYGTSTVTVNFAAVDNVVGKPKLHLVATLNEKETLFDFNRELKADELKAGTAQIDFKPALLDEKGWGEIDFKVDKTAVSIKNARIQLDLPIHEGDKSITGSAGQTVKKVCLAVYAEGEGAIAQGTITTPSSCDDVHRRLLGVAQDIFAHADAAVFAADADQKSAAVQSYASGSGVPQQIVKRITERERVQVGNQILSQSGPLLETLEVPVDGDSHRFTFTLSRPLGVNSKVFVREVFTGDPSGESVAFVGPELATVDSIGMDWGRVRAYLTVGAAISQSNNSLGSASPYISFEADGTFYSKLIRRNFETNKGDGSLTDLFRKSGFGFSVHWNSAVRLTQTGSVMATGSTVGLAPVQSAVFQIGLYTPIRISGMDWMYRGTQYSAFVAPLVRGGATVVKDGVALSQTTTTVVQQPAECTSANCEVTQSTQTYSRANGPAPFTGYGFRVGVMKYTLLGIRTANRQIASDPVMYLDLTWGKNQAYPTPGAMGPAVVKTSTNQGITTTTTTQTQSFDFQTRVAMEARIKVPYLPAEIGSDVNFNWRHPIRGLADAPIGTPTINYTDFRFIFGFHFDVPKAMAAILSAAK